MKKLLFLALILSPTTAAAGDCGGLAAGWGCDGLAEAIMNPKPRTAAELQYDRALNRAVQTRQLEALERENVQRDFEPFRGMFKEPSTHIERGIAAAGDDLATKQRVRETLSDSWAVGR